jgi:hypothetical protein
VRLTGNWPRPIELAVAMAAIALAWFVIWQAAARHSEFHSGQQAVPPKAGTAVP